MFNFLKRFLGMDEALHAAKRAGLVREIASGKGGYKKSTKPKPGAQSDRIKKVPYDKKRWGTLGLSEVAIAIQKDYKCIPDRQDRKLDANDKGTPFTAYTTGKTVNQLPHQVGRQLQKANAYKAKLNSKAWKRGRAQ